MKDIYNDMNRYIIVKYRIILFKKQSINANLIFILGASGKFEVQFWIKMWKKYQQEIVCMYFVIPNNFYTNN